MRALILSAGLGERLRPLTLKRAKPAVEFLNIPMLGFPYFWLDQAKLKEVSFNTHYLPESIRHAAMHVVDPAIPMHFPHEDAILGSGGGIQNAKVYLEGEDHFAVANGDGVILCEELDALAQMFEFHKRKNALATLLVCPLAGVGTKIPGVWMDNYGEVMNFGKEKRAPYVECFHYASFMFFSKRIWNYLPMGPSNILYDVLEPKIAEGKEKVYGYRLDNMHWFETGNVQDYLHATKTCLEYIRDGHPLGRSAKAILDSLAPSYERQSDLQRLRLIADSAHVHGTIDGFAVIGEGSEVPAGTQLKDSVILPNAKLPDGASLISNVGI